jgi:hypothetical protein
MSFRREPLTVTIWPDLHRLLFPAVERGGDTNPQELIEDLLADRAQLWVKRDPDVIAAAVTTVHHDHSLNFQLLGGSRMPDWLGELIDVVRQESAQIGITRFCETGRKGWARVLSRLGWRETAREGDDVTMELELAR